jgi:lipopolysaccharide export system permease protein
MRLLDRYLLRELLIPLGYCLGGFLVFWIAFDLISSLNRYQENFLTLRDVAELYVVKLPELLVLILPISLLLSLLYTLTNHARHNELTAIRAAGVSLMRICAPYLAVGLLLSPMLFVMNEYWAPNGSDREDEIMARHQPQRAGAPGGEVTGSGGFNNTRDGHKWGYGSFDRRTYAMTAPSVWWTSAAGDELMLRADKAVWTNGVWTFLNVVEYGAKPGAEPAEIEQTNLLAMPEFTETPEQVKREIKFASRFAKPSLDSTEVPIAEILDYLDLHPTNLTAKTKWWLHTQLQGRLAAPWTCLVVVLIAIPFGAASGRRNLFAGVAGSIMICFIYFVLLKLGLALGTGGYLPAWLAAWFPNISFSIAAIWLIMRVR